MEGGNLGGHCAVVAGNFPDKDQFRGIVAKDILYGNRLVVLVGGIFIAALPVIAFYFLLVGFQDGKIGGKGIGIEGITACRIVVFGGRCFGF